MTSQTESEDQTRPAQDLVWWILKKKSIDLYLNWHHLALVNTRLTYLDGPVFVKVIYARDTPSIAIGVVHMAHISCPISRVTRHHCLKTGRCKIMMSKSRKEDVLCFISGHEEGNNKVALRVWVLATSDRVSQNPAVASLATLGPWCGCSRRPWHGRITLSLPHLQRDWDEQSLLTTQLPHYKL